MTWWFVVLALVIVVCLLIPDLRRRRRARSVGPAELGRLLEGSRRKTRAARENEPDDDDGPTPGAHHRQG